MAADVAPALLEAVERSFARRTEADRTLQAVLRAVEAGEAELGDVHGYAQALGEALSGALLENLTAETLPDGRLYWNIAERILTPTLRENYRAVNRVAAMTQQYIDQARGIGLKAVAADFPAERVRGLCDQAASAETLDEARVWLGEPVVNTTESFFDDFVEANAEFRYKAGMAPKIVRVAEGNCCEWCRALAGTWDYDDLPADIYKRHERCRCVTTFVNGDLRQDVWTKQKWTEPAEALEKRKTVGLTDDREAAKIEARKNPWAHAEFGAHKPLSWHWEKHKAEFPGWTEQQYLERARELLSLPLEDGVLEELVRSDGSVSRYYFPENEFVAGTKDFQLQTFLHPIDREKYWRFEHERNQ